MDWKVFLATFGAVFFAELADKTQFVGINMTAESGRPLTVWLGSVLAYMTVTAGTVLIGVVLARFIRPEIVKYVGGSLFVIMGILILAGKL